MLYSSTDLETICPEDMSFFVVVVSLKMTIFRQWILFQKKKKRRRKKRKKNRKAEVTNQRNCSMLIDFIFFASKTNMGNSPNFPHLWNILNLLLRMCWGLPWWCSGWESACRCRGHGFEPWSGKIPHAAEQLGPWATITEPACLEPVLRNERPR